MKSLSTITAFSLTFCLVSHSAARAQWDDGYWELDFNSRSGDALNPLVVGIDSGKGFGFIVVSDDDHDGVNHLPPVPNNGGLALGVDADGEVGCDIWDLVGSTMSGGTSSTIWRPLLIVAEHVGGVHVGMDSSTISFPFPPTGTLVSGDRLTATGGQLADWPEMRLVTTDSSVTTLDEYLWQVNSLPDFTGDVIVTDFLLSGNFVVPEPSALLLAAAAGLLLTQTPGLPEEVYPHSFSSRFLELTADGPPDRRCALG
jgi:hypothetical protein